jgi:hypothetical protein
MNVLYLLTTVTKTQAASTLMDRFVAIVLVDILGMGQIARVKKLKKLLYNLIKT